MLLRGIVLLLGVPAAEQKMIAYKANDTILHVSASTWFIQDECVYILRVWLLPVLFFLILVFILSFSDIHAALICSQVPVKTVPWLTTLPLVPTA